MSDQDTICAVSTPPGDGGIGIIRMSGENAVSVASKVFKSRVASGLETWPSHTLRYGHIVDPETGETVDKVLVSVMRAPVSYTRECVVEINCHGGMMPLWRTVSLLIAAGARQADPGEFTKRAFLNGRIDLAQAEAVMDVIRARTELSHRAANEQLRGGLSSEASALRDRLVSLIASVEAGIDFPEEEIALPSGTSLESAVLAVMGETQELLSGYRYGRMMREGFSAAIVGRPNVGKSSLLNALLKQNRAIVTEIPGTTRDVLEEHLNIAGMPLKILDTAGIRHSHDVVEQEGVRRSIAAIAAADIVIVVLDGSAPLAQEDERVLEEAKGKKKPTVAAINKTDLPRAMENLMWPETQVMLSCKTGEGLEGLRNALVELMKRGAVAPREHSWAVNQRHSPCWSRRGQAWRKRWSPYDQASLRSSP
jgi:tRNA modification GTPase